MVLLEQLPRLEDVLTADFGEAAACLSHYTEHVGIGLGGISPQYRMSEALRLEDDVSFPNPSLSCNPSPRRSKVSAAGLAKQRRILGPIG